jgi:outer membrane protein TolC
MKHIELLLILVMISGFLKAQNTHISLSAEEIIAKALDQNFDLRLAEYELIKSKGEVKSANAFSLPDIKLSFTGTSTDNPLMAFGSRLNQERVRASDFAPEVLNDPNRIENFSTMIEIQQPILNFDLKYFKEAARTKVEATNLKTERIRDGIAFQVKQLYMRLQLIYKQLDVLAVAKKTVDESYRVAQNQFEQGLMQKSDLLSISVRVSDIENQVLNAENSIMQLSRQLAMIMNESIDAPIQPSEDLHKEIRSTEAVRISESRSDFQAMQKASEAYRLNHEGLKKGNLPRLNGFANYAFNDNSPVKFRGEGYLVGLQLSWNVLGNKKSAGKLQQSKADYQHSLTEYQKAVSENQKELHNTLRNIENAERRINLTDLSMEQADESLRIRKNRFEEGLERTIDLLQAEATFAEKQMEHHLAIFQYNMSLEYLKFLTKE